MAAHLMAVMNGREAYDQHYSAYGRDGQALGWRHLGADGTEQYLTYEDAAALQFDGFEDQMGPASQSNGGP